MFTRPFGAVCVCALCFTPSLSSEEVASHREGDPSERVVVLVVFCVG